VIIDSGSIGNLVSMEMVEKLNLEMKAHPSLYMVSWLHKGHQVMVSQQCKVEFKIGSYKDEVLCDVIPMDVFHVLLGRLWKYDRNVIHDGKKNSYTLEKNECKDMLLPIKYKGVKEEVSPSILLMSGKELLKEVKKDQEMQFFFIGKPRFILTRNSMNDLHVKVQELLDEFVEIVVDEIPHALPPIRSISHHIELILGEIFLNKEAYKLTPRDNEEVKEQVQDLLDKGLIKESLSPCAVPTVLSPKKDGGWRLCIYSRAINKITIMYRFPLNGMGDFMDCLSGSSYFSKIDLKEWLSSYKNERGR
jgi:hypothetical protein